MFVMSAHTSNRKLRFLVTKRRAPHSSCWQGGLGLCGGEGRSPHVLVALLRRQPECRLPGSAAGHVVAGRKTNHLSPLVTPHQRCGNYKCKQKNNVQGGIRRCGAMTILKLQRRKYLIPSDVSSSMNLIYFWLQAHVCFLFNSYTLSAYSTI